MIEPICRKIHNTVFGEKEKKKNYLKDSLHRFANNSVFILNNCNFSSGHCCRLCIFLHDFLMKD